MLVSRAFPPQNRSAQKVSSRARTVCECHKAPAGAWSAGASSNLTMIVDLCVTLGREFNMSSQPPLLSHESVSSEEQYVGIPDWHLEILDEILARDDGTQGIPWEEFEKELENTDWSSL